MSVASTGVGALRALASQRNAMLIRSSQAQAIRLYSAKDGGDKPEDGKQPGLMSTIFGSVGLVHVQM